MKKYFSVFLVFLLLFSMVSVMTVGVYSQPSSDTESVVLSAYQEVFEDSEYSQYALYDVDKDGTEEMILTNDPDMSFSPYHFYTYKNGSVVDLGEGRAQYGLYGTDDAGILNLSGGTGVHSYEKYNIEGNILTMDAAFSMICYGPTEETLQYMYGGDEISKEEYDAIEAGFTKIEFQSDFVVPQTPTPTPTATPTAKPTATPTATPDEDEDIDYKKLLLGCYWENMIQSYHVYRFFEDGTVAEYALDPGLYRNRDGLDKAIEKADATRTFHYTIDDDGRLEFTFDETEYSSSYSIELEYIDINADIDWDIGIDHHLPTSEKFFYETSFENIVPTEEDIANGFIIDDNAFYLKKTEVLIPLDDLDESAESDDESEEPMEDPNPVFDAVPIVDLEEYVIAEEDQEKIEEAPNVEFYNISLKPDVAATMVSPDATEKPSETETPAETEAPAATGVAEPEPVPEPEPAEPNEAEPPVATEAPEITSNVETTVFIPVSKEMEPYQENVSAYYRENDGTLTELESQLVQIGNKNYVEVKTNREGIHVLAGHESQNRILVKILLIVVLLLLIVILTIVIWLFVALKKQKAKRMAADYSNQNEPYQNNSYRN